MKKILFTTFLAFLLQAVWSQTDQYIYVNHSDNFKGAHYTVPDGSGKYTVLKRNTIYSISKMHGMSVEELKELNGLTDNTIYIGQVLDVRKTTILGSINASKVEGGNISESMIKQNTAVSNHAVWERARVLKSEDKDIENLKGTYIVRDGDVWWHVVGDEETYHAIATHYDMSFDTLKTNNDMSDYFLQSGMILIVAPGKLYGMKEMPVVMPALKPEEVLTTEEAETMMNSSDALLDKTDELVEDESSEVTEGTESADIDW